MDMQKKQILIIDDSTDDNQFVMEHLKDDYAIVVATSGYKGLEMAKKEPYPDLILLDVMMPGMDGYTTCQELKSNPETAEIDVIFVSAHSDTEEKLKGYDVGGSDYLIKPVQPEELVNKVNLTLKNKDVRAEAAEMKDSALKIALTSMSSTSEFGVIIDFMKHLPLISDVNFLAHAILNSMNDYELKASIQMRCTDGKSTGGVNINLNQENSITQIEIDILEHYKDKEKIVERGLKTIFNFDEISLLIKNMPEDDVKRGRLRDNISILLEASVGKLSALKRDQNLLQIVSTSQSTIINIEHAQQAHKEKSQTIMDDMLKQIEDSFDFWGLTEEQEKLMLSILHDGIDKSLSHFETGLKMDKEMAVIFDNIFKVVKE